MIRYEFFNDSIKEEDIHPEEIYYKERKIAEKLAKEFIPSGEVQPCPFCGGKKDEILFEKWGYRYAICPTDWSISVASMPDEDILHSYFHDSELSRFRASKKVQDIMNERRKELWEGQFDWIEGRVSRYLGNRKCNVLDWGSKSVGWVDYLTKASFINEVHAFETLPPITGSKDLNELTDIICLIDALQRQHQPLQLFERIAGKLKAGGLLFITCRAGSGLDILTLRSASDSIFPLDHLILPSPEGMEILLGRAGFEMIEITTPGLLDMEYLKKSREKIPRDQYFLRYLVERKDDDLLHRMQGFLQRNNLSSHLRCIAKKK